MFLLDEFLDSFSKFRLIIAEICILIWYLWVIFKNYSMRMLSIRGNDIIAHWAYEETISSHTESTLNKFFAHAQLAVKCFLHFYIFYMYIQTYAEHAQKRFHRTLSILGNNFIACWAYVEMISSLAEHTQKWFNSLLSMRRTNITLQIAALHRCRKWM
jgi:hypothetical protein